MPVEQTELALFDRPEVPSGYSDWISADRIHTTNAVPSDEFLGNIRRVGVLEPILLRRPATTTGQFRVIDGRRRVEAMRRIDAERPIPAIVFPHDTSERILASIALSANLHRAPQAVTEYQAIKNLIDTGATIPQIARTLMIPEATIVARLRIGQLIRPLRELLSAGNMSASLAQRLGAETTQTQDRIYTEWQQSGETRLTARQAFLAENATQNAEDVEPDLFVLESINRFPAVEIFTALNDEQRVELYRNLFRTMQPANIQTFMESAPTQTVREFFRIAYAHANQSEEWMSLLEQMVTAGRMLRTISTFIERNGPNAFLAQLPDAARQRLRDFFNETLRLQAEGRRQTSGEGRAHREMLEGPSDDPAERGENLSPDAVIAAAQFDYQSPVEESWETVAAHLTVAADALPLSPSDECDTFHREIETLRTRAERQIRAERANEGVAVGRVEPPPPREEPQPVQENANRVRPRRPRRTTTGDFAPANLDQLSRLLTEQAEAINANTTPAARRTAQVVERATSARIRDNATFRQLIANASSMSTAETINAMDQIARETLMEPTRIAQEFQRVSRERAGLNERIDLAQRVRPRRQV